MNGLRRAKNMKGSPRMAGKDPLTAQRKTKLCQPETLNNCSQSQSRPWSYGERANMIGRHTDASLHNQSPTLGFKPEI